MPNDRARKQHIRTQQQPGESYTAAMRRLATDPGWELDGQGLGSTEYRGDVDGVELLVTFAGDHRHPWLGWWDVLADPDDTAEVVVSGRYRFTTPTPSDDDIAGALTQITDLVRQVSAGQSPETVSTEHGPALEPGDVTEDGTYFIAWDADTWTIATVTGAADPNWWQLDADTDVPATSITWRDGSWVDDAGRTLTVYAL